VHAELQNGEANLAQVRADIARAEADAMRAKARVTFEECRSTQASVRAEATLTVAECRMHMAEHAQCESHNESHTAEAGVAGCALGMLGALFSFGATALIGCGAGLAVGAATTDNCPAAACSADPAVALRAALAHEHLSQYPPCGGSLGVYLATFGGAVSIAQILPGGPAATAGLAAGDVLVAIDGEATHSAVDVARVVENHPP
jgi:hypothetical protein